LYVIEYKYTKLKLIT